jgi:hypothetical protein
MVTSNLVGRRSYWAPGPDEYLWYRQFAISCSKELVFLTVQFCRDKIREYRDESQRLDQCSRLYDSSISNDNFELDASRIAQVRIFYHGLNFPGVLYY